MLSQHITGARTIQREFTWTKNTYSQYYFSRMFKADKPSKLVHSVSLCIRDVELQIYYLASMHHQHFLGTIRNSPLLSTEETNKKRLKRGQSLKYSLGTVIRQYLVFFKMVIVESFALLVFGERDHFQDANKIQLKNVSASIKAYLWGICTITLSLFV